MPEKKLRYFQLKPHVGSSPEEPLVSVGLSIQVPTMVGGEIVDLGAAIVLSPAAELKDGDDARIIPNTRVVEVRHYAIADAISQLASYEEIEKPSASQVGSQRADATERAREKSTTTAKEQ
jgi:hypothetical protein